MFYLQASLSSQRLPRILAMVKNITARLQPYQYLQNQGLYSKLSLYQLVQELSQLKTDVGQIHSQMNNAKTQKLFQEVKENTMCPDVTPLIPRVCELVLGYNSSAADKDVNVSMFDRWMDWVNMWRNCKRQTSST